MINMQSAFLIVSKSYSEKQAGVLFFVFGMSQFLFQTPAGYLYDYTENKIMWLSTAGIATTLLTLITATFAAPEGGNLTLMVLVKFVQGAVTSFIPPGLNSITQGIVGAAGMTEQVAVNEMFNHLGTALIVLSGSLLGVLLYPDLGFLFIVSPIACLGFLFFIQKINPTDIDHSAARGLAQKEPPSTTSAAAADYTPPSAAGGGEEDEAAPTKTPETGKKHFRTQPSFNFGWKSLGGDTAFSTSGYPKADSPLHVLRDPSLLTFVLIVFLFHTANGTVLPLVMQTLAIDSGRTGILMSGLCIIVAQIFMVFSAKVCGDYSGKYGRKPLFLIGLFTVPARCLILTLLLVLRGDGAGSPFLRLLILSTQILDGVGAGVFGTMYILVTSDISGGTGRFSMTLGVTTAAASIGGTVSGYLGEALAEDLGYKEAYFILMFMSLVPALLYLVFMPETLASLTGKAKDHELGNIASIKEEGEHESETGPAAQYAEMT
jgi:MFS family permease